MTDRYKGLIITLERDIREDDAEHLINAIRMLRGVASVSPMLNEPGDIVNRERIRHEVRQKLFDAVDAALKGD